MGLARKWKPTKIYSWSNHYCQSCWRFSGGTCWVTAASQAQSLDELGLHSWKHFQIFIFVLCRSAGQGLILYLTAYVENYTTWKVLLWGTLWTAACNKWSLWYVKYVINWHSGEQHHLKEQHHLWGLNVLFLSVWTFFLLHTPTTHTDWVCIGSFFGIYELVRINPHCLSIAIIVMNAEYKGIFWIIRGHQSIAVLRADATDSWEHRQNRFLLI